MDAQTGRMFPDRSRIELAVIGIEDPPLEGRVFYLGN